MKTSITLLLALFFLASCKKEENLLLKLMPAKPTAIAAKPDTIPDSAELKIRLVKDSINTDETMFVFDHKSSLKYVFDQDSPYFQGFGQISLASISSDGRDLVMNGLPYTPGMSISLDVNVKTDGSYFLGISYEKKIPADLQIWVKDAYLKDSVDVRLRNYSFSVSKADTNSYGNKRFKIVLSNNGKGS